MFGLDTIGTILVATLAGLGIFLVWFAYESIKPVKVVDLLRPRDGRGATLKVKRETDTGLDVGKVDKTYKYFVKVGRAWTFVKNFKTTTKFFAQEGTAYTTSPDYPKDMKITLAEALRLIVSGEYYENKIPTEIKEKIERSKWGLTIEMEPIKTEELPALSSDIVYDEEDKKFAEDLVAGKKKADKNKVQYIQIAFGFFAGAFIIYLATHMEWIR